MDDPYQIMMQCRQEQIIIRGDTNNLSRLLTYKRTGVYKRHVSYYARKFLESFLHKLGRVGEVGGVGEAGEAPLSPVNDYECTTSVPVSAIPKTHYFEVIENGHIYAYDIRTLVADKVPFNSYTGIDLDRSNQSRLARKVKWLRRYYPNAVAFCAKEPDMISVDQLITEVFNKLNKCVYVDRVLFENLTIVQLKELYYILNENMIGRNSETLLLFSDLDYLAVCDDLDQLRRLLLNDINLLTSEVNGSITFLLGLTHVSPEADHYYGALLRD